MPVPVLIKLYRYWYTLGQYPGLFIFTGAARMMRPVWNLAASCVEYIGTFEQVPATGRTNSYCILTWYTCGGVLDEPGRPLIRTSSSVRRFVALLHTALIYRPAPPVL
ncbi:MAG: hypothetical protein FJ333_10310 [Sphingomonadales bacterium]|nr:hypothetical protein [Sphingomonadales bacterium]